MVGLPAALGRNDEIGELANEIKKMTCCHLNEKPGSQKELINKVCSALDDRA